MIMYARLANPASLFSCIKDGTDDTLYGLCNIYVQCMVVTAHSMEIKSTV